MKASEFRCGLCSKLFMGEEYVRKHILLKHITVINSSDKIEKRYEELMFERYCSDGNRFTNQLIYPVGPPPWMGTPVMVPPYYRTRGGDYGSGGGFERGRGGRGGRRGSNHWRYRVYIYIYIYYIYIYIVGELCGPR